MQSGETVFLGGSDELLLKAEGVNLAVKLSWAPKGDVDVEIRNRLERLERENETLRNLIRAEMSELD